MTALRRSGFTLAGLTVVIEFFGIRAGFLVPSAPVILWATCLNRL